MNSDRSVAVGSGLSLNPGKNRFYDSFDKLRFEHLQRLRNDASCRARELNIIDPDVIAEIYGDSEYTGEKRLIYLMIRSEADMTMCLKQNPKIKRWKEETIKKGHWEDYGENYHVASQDFILAETGRSFRFIVKQNKETHETRCFGSTHTDYSPIKILDSYHIRWPVEP